MEVTCRGLEGLRSDEAFYQVFHQSCIVRCDELGIEQPNLPWVHKRPKRYEHEATGSHQWASAEGFIRVQYFKFLDSTIVSLKRRYDQPGIQTYIKLESILIKPVTAVVDMKSVVEQYPEFDSNTLHIQLYMTMLKQMIGTVNNLQKSRCRLWFRSSLALIQLLGAFPTTCSSASDDTIQQF